MQHPRSYRLKFPDFPRSGATPSVLRVRPASPPPKGPGSQAALKLEPRELWIAAHVPQLALLALRRPQDTRPLVVVDSDDHNQRIVDADPLAQEAGVRPGMSLGAALAAAPDIEPRPRDPQRERELMQHLAQLVAQFTPRVSIEPPDGLLLEIKPSIMLFGGLRELCRRVRDTCRADALFARIRAEPHFTLAPTALAALLAARAGARCFITDPAVLPARLKPLPLAVLRWPGEHNARLVAMGVRTLGELLRLPRAGFARRFGPGLLADLDRLLGKRADPRARLAPRERYRGALDLDHEIEDHERILQALAPLLAQLERFLQARQRGVTALQCRFHHYRADATRCTLRLAAPEVSAARFTCLLRERLASLVLPEPVRRCELRAGVPRLLLPASRALWSPGEHGHVSAAEMPSLIEHLRARLGAQALHGIRRVAEHRPERAWCAAEPMLDERPAEPRADAGRDRPSWLLAAPEPLPSSRGRPRHHGALHLLEGPERIESGWWDGDDIRRDYYVARDASGAMLWIYRECTGQRRWFLHGIFG
jgi:protein ImuB